jgi:uncharacterized protein (DUF2249 family)
MTTSLDTPCLDLRRLAPRDRHSTVFGACQQLPLGAAFELVNDHNPQPLQQQVQQQWAEQLSWQVLEAGPSQWRVRIQRVGEPRSCCGSCGG